MKIILICIFQKSKSVECFDEATQYLKTNTTIKVGGIIIETSADRPLRFKNTDNEDSKGIDFYDKNDTLRYQLVFYSGHLYFKSFNSNGSALVDKQIV